MAPSSGKRVARTRLTLTEPAVEALKPGDRPWTAWDDRLTGFGVRVEPSGTKSFLVNYRTGGGGRKAPNKRVVLGRHGDLSPGRARRMARRLLDEVAAAELARERTRAMPVLAEAFEDYRAANPDRAQETDRNYRALVRRYLADWLARPLDTIARRDVEDRFNRITANHGWSQANLTLTLLRSVYRRPCVDLEGLPNPVDLWLAAGGRFHRRVRRRISAPAEVLPCWCAGIEAAVAKPAVRDAFWFGLYTGMRVNEVLPLRWERVDIEGRVFRIEQTKTGVALELPITRQLGAVLDRRWQDSGAHPDGWVFPSDRSGSGHIAELSYYHGRIGAAGGAKFWYHGLRNCFITVAERDLLLPSSLTKRLVNHAPPGDITEGYAADWTIGQLREPAQRIADRIEALMTAGAG